MISAHHVLQRLGFLAIFAIAGLTAGCDHSIVEGGNIGNTDTTANCDTVAVSYATTIRPLIDSVCISCHTEDNNPNLDFSTYEGVKEVAESGQLVGAITHDPDFTPMPQGMPMLDDCMIAKVRSWVRDGAQNN